MGFSDCFQLRQIKPPGQGGGELRKGGLEAGLVTLTVSSISPNRKLRQ